MKVLPTPCSDWCIPLRCAALLHSAELNTFYNYRKTKMSHFGAHFVTHFYIEFFSIFGFFGHCSALRAVPTIVLH